MLPIMPPNRGAIGGRGVGAEEKAHGPQMQVQLLLHHAGLDDGPVFFGIHLEHSIQVFRHVDDDRFADGLPGQTGSRTARKNGNFEVAGDFHRGENVLMSAGNHDADRFDFIDTGVGAVEKREVSSKRTSPEMRFFRA